MPDTIDVITPLYGHVSADTAYEVIDYETFSRSRYWLETDARRGVRLVTQKGRNKPQRTTYAPVDGCMFTRGNGYVSYYALHEFSAVRDVGEFVRLFPGHDMTRIREMVGNNIRCHEDRLSGRVPEEDLTKDDIEWSRAEVEEWRAVAQTLEAAGR